jgi:hypothetical protein
LAAAVRDESEQWFASSVALLVEAVELDRPVDETDSEHLGVLRVERKRKRLVRHM